MSTALVLARPAAIARQTIARHSKSFALASRLLDARTRDQIAIVYTWCRRADDAIDEHDHSSETLPRLHAELDAAYTDRALHSGPTPLPHDAVLRAFGDVARERQIPILYPRELLAGMEMDVDGAHYTTLADLRLYCWRVAGVVGLMMSHVFGVAHDDALVHAAHLGIAMQLTNICRDVAEDWDRGRVYVPEELIGRRLQRHGPIRRDVFTRPVRELLAIADRYYASGERGLRYLPWRARLSVRAASRVYRAIGGRIAARGFDVTAGRVVVSTSSKLAHVLAAAARTAFSLPVAARVPAHTLELADVTEP